MAKIKSTKTLKFAGRILFNIIIAGIIYSIVTSLLNSLQTTTGAIIGGLVSLAVLLFVIPTIFDKRPGAESLTSLVIALPAGAVMIGLVKTILNISITIPTLADSMVIGSVPMAMAVASYFLADWIFIMYLEK